jgi:hypothetical protein
VGGGEGDKKELALKQNGLVGAEIQTRADPSYERCQVLNWELRSLVLEAGSYVWSPATLDQNCQVFQNVSRPKQIGGDCKKRAKTMRLSSCIRALRVQK